MKKQVSPLILLLSIILLTGCSGVNEQTVPVNLRTEYLYEPIGIDTPSPRFTWEYSGEEDGFMASRTEVRVGTSPEDIDYLPGEIGFAPHTRYYWNVAVWDKKGRKCALSETASFETGKMSPADWTGKWITDDRDKEHEPAPLFRRKFTLDKELKEARAYIAAAGYYEMFINGERVGENYLDPGYTHFDKRILYVTHDITALMKQGDNAIATVLGNAWYNIQSKAVWDFETARWRNRPRMLCELRLTYTDGTVETVVTDENWRTATGPYTYNNLYSGDMYDARLEEEGWKTATFDDAHWCPAVLTEAPAPFLAAQQMPGIRITEELIPTDIRMFSDKLYLYSFNRNISGLPHLKVKGAPGTRIALKHGELQKDDGRLEQGNINVYYHPEKPYEVFQTDVFTLKGTGEEEVFMPSFSYHGFQYIEVESSAPVALTEESLTALFMHTDVEAVGSFTCSDPLLDKIWDATMLAYRSNLHSIPTDCPQREKNGWTADAHIAIDLALLGFDAITVYEKWMNDFIDNQRDNGMISGIIPSSGWGFGEWPGPVWDAALFIIPNALYDYYGDTRCIENLYPTMERYMEYLLTKEKGGFLTFGLGDWVYWNATTNNEYTSTAYYYLDNILMARFAGLLGKDAVPYEQKAAKLKELINSKFFHPETGVYAEGTQTAQAIALHLGLVPEGREQLVADKLREVVAANNHFLDFGLLGSKTVPAMLTRYGYVEDAMLMVTKTDAPSWGYWVETMGYTTLPETWTLSPEFRDASLNHVFMGDVSAWMMNQLAGINHSKDNPGFGHIRITPHFVKGLDWVKGEYKSVRGRIASEWERNNTEVVLTVTIPSGCTADIVAGGRTQSVASGTHRFVFTD